MSGGHLTDSGIGASSSSVVNSNDETIFNQPLLSDEGSSKSSGSSSVSYRDAISAPERILEETVSSDGNDDEDDDGDFVPDDHYVPLSIEMLPSTKDRFRTKQPITTIDLRQDTSSRHNRRRKKGSMKITGFDTSDEDDVLIKNAVSPSPQVQRSKSIEAIKATLENIFGQSMKEPQTRPTKRTVLTRSAGQTMTEKDVIA